ncbi:MAG: DUF4430 domain-containing protein [bacterium]
MTNLTGTTLAIALAIVLAGCSSTPAHPSASTHVGFAFGGAHADIAADVPFDGAARPADSYFRDNGVTHTSYTAFDQLVQWSTASGTPIVVRHFSFGFCLDKVGGAPDKGSCEAGANAYWSLAVNGTESQVGMDAVTLHAADSVSWTLTSIAPMSTPSAPASPPVTSTNPPAPTSDTVAFSAPTNVTVHQGVAVINGTAPAGVLSFKADADAGPGAFTRGAGGSYALTLPVAAGQTNVTVTFDDGKVPTSHSLVVTRLVQGTMQVDFRGVPGHANRNDAVWIDVDGRASASYYQGQSVAHPSFANVHDLMVAWTAATDVPVVYKPHATFGQQVMQIDGVGDVTGNSAAFWCYKVNGSSNVLGITSQPFAPGDVVSWSLGSVC